MKKYFAIVLSAVLFAGCVDLLNTYPADELSTENMWTTEELTDSGIRGLYQNFYYTSIEIYLNSGMSNTGICRTGWVGMDFMGQMSATDNDIGLRALVIQPPKSSSVNFFYHEWRWAYTGIHRCNEALENLGRAPISTEKYNRYVCESKFLRAFYYSRLVKIFGGVPIYLRPITDADCDQPENTPIECWQAVVDDLTDCIENEYFPTNTLTGSNYGRPSKGAAYALRGQAYMYLAWENGEDNSYYQLAANDYEKVSTCGYGLFTAGPWEDFFTKVEYETDHEMIFPLQWTAHGIYASGGDYGDWFQRLIGTRDVFNCECHIRPSTDWINSFQNADGSKFNWTDVIPEWNNSEFVNDLSKREVFVFRDSIEVDATCTVLGGDESVAAGGAYWDEDTRGFIQERVNRINGGSSPGDGTFQKYYIGDKAHGYANEARIKAGWENRDPRLKKNVLVMYEPVDVYYSGYNGGETAVGKQLRWPIKQNLSYVSYEDMHTTTYTEKCFYVFNKRVIRDPARLENRSSGEVDWPLIRYTEVYLKLAECYAHLGRLGDAINIVNEIRARVGMPSVSVGSYDEVMEAIRYECRSEFALEGIDYFDEWRWGTYYDIKFQGHDTWGDQTYWGEAADYNNTWYWSEYMYPWAYPYDECIRNPNLTKREGWRW